MSYPPVGYVVIRHYKDRYMENIRFYHDLESAEKYCDEQNKICEKDFYYEPCEIDIHD